jgi:predicted RNase H-like HicB family nuclease
MSRHYSFRIEWSEENEAFIGRCLEFPSLAAHAPTPNKALKSIEEVVEESVQWMEEDGEEIPAPIGSAAFQVKLLFRATPELHRELAFRSCESGVSINQLLLSLVE